jgi:hypothetical protein
MSSNESHRLQLLHTAQANAQLALDKIIAQAHLSTAHAQLALDETNARIRIAEAEPTEAACPIHLEERERHIQHKYSSKLLTCEHCYRCAFCEPRYDMCCWAGVHGAHPPKRKWEIARTGRHHRVTRGPVYPPNNSVTGN